MVQVDISPTLALLFGVPIPKNNVGVLIPGTLASLTGHFTFFPSIFFINNVFFNEERRE